MVSLLWTAFWSELVFSFLFYKEIKNEKKAWDRFINPKSGSNRRRMLKQPGLNSSDLHLSIIKYNVGPMMTIWSKIKKAELCIIFENLYWVYVEVDQILKLLNLLGI